ncbi:ABC transporter ATP-binding protein [Nostoc sp. 3335mG]|nr:ABC transporter ATP-binding protein [Nostoc sp. 3335mG]
MSKLLEVKSASVVFDTGGGTSKRALDDVSLEIGGSTPSITAVVGESGSGKSTLIRLLLGFQQPTTGEVAYDGQNVAGLPSEAARTFRREVQAIFQDPFDAFNPFYKIDHPLLSPLKAFRLVSSRDQAYGRIEETLRSVGLDPANTLGKYPHQLSGGQRQRVMIARALLLDPQIILADEPVSMVDASLRATILDILHGLKQDLGISLIYVTHDLTTAYQVADTIVVLHSGHIMEVGPAEKVIHDPRHAYTRALIDAVPSPDPDKPWNLDEPAPLPDAFLPADTSLALYPTEPDRAIAGSVQRDKTPVSAAEVQRAIMSRKAAP